MLSSYVHLSRGYHPLNNSELESSAFQIKALPTLIMDASTFRAYKTTLEMLADRGYKIPKKFEFSNLEDLVTHFGANPITLSLERTTFDNLQDQLMVLFPTDPKIGKEFARNFVKSLKDQGISQGILVSKGSTPTAEAIKLANASNVAVFTEKEMAFNVTRHVLVPRHEVLSDVDKHLVMTQYRITEEQFPKIRITDPVVKYYGLQIGQVVRIHRKSQSAGDYLHYRIVSAN